MLVEAASVPVMAALAKGEVCVDREVADARTAVFCCRRSAEGVRITSAVVVVLVPVDV